MAIDPQIQIERALRTAVSKHYRQRDKSGHPYIFHVLRVWTAVRDAGYGHDFQCAALLHDVVEDTSCTIEDVRFLGLDLRVTEAVDALTKYPKESYDEYLDRCTSNYIACIVKRADNRDNAARNRFIEDRVEQKRLKAKYEGALVKIDRTLDSHRTARSSVL